jgi:hypothetical protein
VSSYQVKISESCFVWAVPTVLRGGPLHNMALNSLRGANNVLDSNPARVKAREEVHTRSILITEDPNMSSNEPDVTPSPNYYSLELRGIQTTVRLVLPVRNNH